jgi:multidrug resistance protein MdtO
VKLVINVPPLHFLWVIATLFFAFYGINTLKNYMAAVTFVNTNAFGIPLWDQHVSAETKVEDMLWLCLGVLIAIVITGAVELVFVRRRPGDEVLLSLTERLSAVEGVLSCYADGRAPDPATEQRIARLAMLGTSLLRRILRRSDVLLPQNSAAASGVAVRIGRLVDLAATLSPLSFEYSADDRRRFGNLASTLARIRNDLMNREIPVPAKFTAEIDAAGAPLLGEMERIATFMTDVFAGTRSAQEYVSSADDLEQPTLLSRDAFVNPDHLHLP